MELFIRIKDGQPFEHPIFGDNFREAFPHVDVNNLPPDFARFERVQPPVWGPYDKNQRVTYERGADGVYRDVWACDPMTADEVKAKQDEVKAQWAASDVTFKSWAFDEEKCAFEAPVPYPTTGKSYYWEESSLSWVELPIQKAE
jgi:hypothetical protein